MTTPSVSDAPASDFGVRMASRVRPRLVSRRGGLQRSTVGRVGRSSLGFCRAIGRAQGVRPVVRVADLNSTSLRPPVRQWNFAAAEEPQPGADWSAPVAAGSTWTEKLLTGPSSSAAPVQRKVVASPAPKGDKFAQLQAMLAEGPTPNSPWAENRDRVPVNTPPWLLPDANVGPGQDRLRSAEADQARISAVEPSGKNPAESSPVGVEVDARVAGSTRGDTAAGPATSPGRKSVV